jgi:hypothetical protein
MTIVENSVEKLCISILFMGEELKKLCNSILMIGHDPKNLGNYIVVELRKNTVFQK